ncbi:glycoside hydrolase family 13 protein [Lacticaseibacillus sp. GG6-2]
MLNLAAMHRRPDSEDCFSISSERLRLRFATGQDVASVVALVGDPYMDRADGQVRYREVALLPLGRGQVHDYWGQTIQTPYHRLRYLFAVVGKNGDRWLFTAQGPRPDSEEARGVAENYYRMPYLHAVDAVDPPEWVSETVWYQIFVERFANGSTANDPQHTKPWQPQTHPGRNDFYGGDLQGVLDHLDDLEALGVNGLYFCPLFLAPSNHKYDTTDYYQIDPAFGDKELFTKVVQAAHERGMRVMLDAVFNHLGETALPWQDVLANGQRSRFRDWFHLYDWPLTPYRDPRKNEGRPQYDAFGFEPSMPKLNTANPEVQDYLLAIAIYWAKNFGIDAWRLDVANEIDHHFWRRFKASMVAIRPDFYVLGEVWQTGQPWLNGGEFDGVMNYPFTQPILNHFLQGQLTPAGLCAQLVDHLMQFRDPVNQAQLNPLGSHDTPRLMTIANGDHDAVVQALAFTFMQEGAPCLYYGTEMGMTGEADPDNRKPMDWTRLHGQMWRQVAALVHLRRRYATVLGRGTTTLTTTETGLIKVTRRWQTTVLSGWFNTTSTSQPVQAEAVLAEGYDDGILAPKGFVIEKLTGETA